MRRKQIIYLVIFILLQMIKRLLISDYVEEYGDSRIEVSLNKRSQVTYEDMRMKEGYDKCQPVMLSQSEELEVKGCQNARIIAATANRAQLERLYMIEGAFFSEEANKEERDLAIISSQLSIKLFGSEKGVGNILSIANEKYQIVGVYKKHVRLRDYVFDDGIETIYIPIKSSVARNWGIQNIVIDNRYKEEQATVNDLQTLEINNENGHISDRSKWAKNLTSLSQIPLILFWFFLCIGIFKGYLRSLKDKVKSKGIKIAEGIIYAVMLYFLFKTCFSKVYIDPNTLPPDNLFDISFYLEELKAEWIRRNQFIGSKVSHFERAIYHLRLMIYSISLIQILITMKLSFVEEARK